MGSSGWFEDIHRRIVNFALKTGLPALFVRRHPGDDVIWRPLPEMYGNAANYVVKILSGDSPPANLQVVQSTRVEPTN